MRYNTVMEGQSLMTMAIEEFLVRLATDAHTDFLSEMDAVYYERKQRKIGKEAFVMHWFTEPVEKVVKDVVINPASDFGHCRLSIRYNWGRHGRDFMVPLWRYDRVYSYRKPKKMMHMAFLERLGWEMQRG
jgi:hypothetical protein